MPICMESVQQDGGRNENNEGKELGARTVSVPCIE